MVWTSSPWLLLSCCFWVELMSHFGFSDTFSMSLSFLVTVLYAFPCFSLCFSWFLSVPSCSFIFALCDMGYYQDFTAHEKIILIFPDVSLFSETPHKIHRLGRGLSRVWKPYSFPSLSWPVVVSMLQQQNLPCYSAQLLFLSKLLPTHHAN